VKLCRIGEVPLEHPKEQIPSLAIEIPAHKEQAR
jgi:hypothetical protein